MTDNSNPQLVFVTCPEPETARRIASSLVNGRHAACVNVLPGITSVYEWQGKLCEDAECLLLIKTTAERMEGLQAAILAEHPYELPEIIAVPICSGLPGYLDWVKQTVKDANA